MIHLITYGDDNFKNSRERLYQQAVNCKWFDTITVYSPDDLSPDFKDKYKTILSQSRIGGYGIWRPFIIKKSLDKISDDDILIYLDAGCTINKHGTKRFRNYIDMVSKSNEGALSFQMPHTEKKYTTKELFNYFQIPQDGDIANSGQILDGILIMKKTQNLLHMNNLCLQVLTDNPLLFTDYYNAKQESYFIDNRHEQSIYSLIRKLGNPILLSDETWHTPFGSDESLYYPFWATRIRG